MSKEQQEFEVIEEAEIIAGLDDNVLHHNYDGIKEMDNDLPGWWINLFFVCTAFAIVYVTGYHILSTWDLQEIEYRRAMGWFQDEGKEDKKEAPKPEKKEVLVASKKPAVVAKGKEHFMSKCMPCHGLEGQGVIGPNLTDKFWVHGGSFPEIVKVIEKGGRPGKGMQAWNMLMNKTEIQEVASYIVSLQGTNPANAKAAEGDLYDGEY